jgi:DNA-binding NarL/FixJ family response regulator
LTVPAVLARAEIGLVDLRLGEELATESLPRLREQVPLLRLIWVTGIGEPYLLEQALRLNLPGFVHKEDSIDVLVAAIERVHGGGTFLSPTVARMRDEMRRDPVHFAKILSEREQQVLALIGKGLSNEETAALLGLSAGTIHSHRRNIMERLGLRTAAEVQSYALQYGFTSPGRLVSARSHAAGDPGR